MSRIVVRNATEYPDAEVFRLVRFAFSDLELPSRWSILVRVNYTRLSDHRRKSGTEFLYGATGTAYNYVHLRRDVPKGAGYEVRCSIGRPEDFPVEWHQEHGAQVERIGTLNDWRDALVAVAAHEGKHIEEYQRGQTRGRRQLSTYAVEARCDAYAASRMRAWRSSE